MVGWIWSRNTYFLSLYTSYRGEEERERKWQQWAPVIRQHSGQYLFGITIIDLIIHHSYWLIRERVLRNVKKVAKHWLNLPHSSFQWHGRICVWASRSSPTPLSTLCSRWPALLCVWTWVACRCPQSSCPGITPMESSHLWTQDASAWLATNPRSVASPELPKTGGGFSFSQNVCILFVQGSAQWPLRVVTSGSRFPVCLGWYPSQGKLFIVRQHHAKWTACLWS